MWLPFRVLSGSLCAFVVGIMILKWAYAHTPSCVIKTHSVPFQPKTLFDFIPYLFAVAKSDVIFPSIVRYVVSVIIFASPPVNLILFTDEYSNMHQVYKPFVFCI